ncbi:hypothetical protein jhhlp_002766 [Lomentospora prolificans]|uniref:Uncharacterized protein n=1 Tax=Lomentospora prolificans TaxID=41688 RepID=A0A2N3NF34_9PEZI|nr:hypothetical protein jhhlp_002766 [Lomentospora prolificans]
MPAVVENTDHLAQEAIRQNAVLFNRPAASFRAWTIHDTTLRTLWHICTNTRRLATTINPSCSTKVQESGHWYKALDPIELPHDINDIYLRAHGTIEYLRPIDRHLAVQGLVGGVDSNVAGY